MSDKKKGDYNDDNRTKYVDKLPNKIIVIKNKDKQFDEKWYPNRNIANFPAPFRMCLVGAVGGGKTNTAKNIILRAHPQYDKIILCHCDKSSKEWDDLDLEPEDKFFNSQLPPLEFFEGKEPKEKWLLIIEDCEFKNEGKNNELSMLFRYISSHKKVSIMLLYQNFTGIPKIARRLANVFVCWKIPDTFALETIGRKCGLKKGELIDLFERVATGPKDSITLDMTPETPAPLRLNVFQKIIKQ
jgi:hypothetical protein